MPFFRIDTNSGLKVSHDFWIFWVVVILATLFLSFMAGFRTEAKKTISFMAGFPTKAKKTIRKWNGKKDEAGQVKEGKAGQVLVKEDKAGQVLVREDKAGHVEQV